MKVKILGWKNEELSIVNRLERGFIELGHEIAFFNEIPDLLIAINPDVYNDAIEEEVTEGGLKIFNVLDVPEHLLDTYPINDIKEQLKEADVITSISHFTKKQIKKYFKKNAQVVYTPSLEIENIPRNKDIDFLYVGRATDPNKRFDLIVNGMRDAGMPLSSLTVCGPDPISCGIYRGVVTSTHLNELYNQAKVVLLPSKLEGVGLSMIEGAMAQAIPLTCSDNKTVKEFGLEEFCAEPDPESYGRAMMKTLINFLEKKQRVQEIVKEQDLFHKFDKKTVAQKYIDIYENRTNSISV